MKILKTLGKVTAFVLGGAALVAAGKSGFGKDLFTGRDAEPLNEDENDDFVEATEVTEVPAEEAVEPEPTAEEAVEEDS